MEKWENVNKDTNASLADTQRSIDRTHWCSMAENAASSESQQNGTYVVVMRAPAAFYFGREDPLPTMRFPSEIGPLEVTFGTARRSLTGFHHPIRCGLWADARGEAPSLGLAVEVFANFTRGVAAVLSVAANASMGNFTADIMYDITSGRSERQYWRRALPEEPLMINSGRRLPSDLAVGLLTAWMTWLHHGVKDTDRWHRAFTQYHHALQSWEPGLEIDALGHLWVGMEALTPIKLRQISKAEGKDNVELAQSYQVDIRGLDAEIRRRYLFGGDDECYSLAREARSGLQHAYRPLWDVRDRALRARNQTANYLRTALLEMVGLDPGLLRVLLSPPFDRPLFWSVTTEIHGWLVGNSDELARSEDVYPRVDWDLIPVELPVDAEGDAGLSFEVWVDPKLADGVRYVYDRVSMIHPLDDDA